MQNEILSLHKLFPCFSVVNWLINYAGWRSAAYSAALYTTVDELDWPTQDGARLPKPDAILLSVPESEGTRGWR